MRARGARETIHQPSPLFSGGQHAISNIHSKFAPKMERMSEVSKIPLCGENRLLWNSAMKH
jgi:hypothetical protein